MVIFASRALGCPVKWTETRSENYRATIHGRDHIQDVEMAAKKDGTIVGLRAKVWANLGAYLSTASTGIPTILHGLMLSGAYDIKNIHEDVFGVFTNTTPIDAYRGAGRPEATFMVERLVDLVAKKLNMDPVDDPPEELHSAVHRRVHGRHRSHLRHRQLRRGARQEPRDAGLRARPQGAGGAAPEGPVPRRRLLDLRRDLRPRPVAGRRRRRLRRRAVGERDRSLPPLRQGQRLRRHLAARPGRGDDVRADRRRASSACRRRRRGDPRRHGPDADGLGQLRQPVDAGRQRRAHGRDRQDQGEGRRSWRRTCSRRRLTTSTTPTASSSSRERPSRSKTIQDIALMANVAWNYPTGLEPGLEASAFFDPSNFVYPFGAHVAVVQVDAETGEIKLERYIAVDDCGRVINPDDRRGTDPRRHRPGHRPGAVGRRAVRRRAGSC